MSVGMDPQRERLAYDDRAEQRAQERERAIQRLIDRGYAWTLSMQMKRRTRSGLGWAARHAARRRLTV